MAGATGDEAKNPSIQIISMVGGEDDSSYARNSALQRLILREVKPILEKCIEELLGEMEGDDLIKVADLGCSSGPNTFLTVEHILESIDKAAAGQTRNDQEPPAIQYFLNDLFSSDFNLAFKGLPQFYEKLEKEYGRPFGSCLVAAMPGSFYRKLFPDCSMHFIHSSYSLHWLSQAPKGLVTESGIPMNKGSINCGKKSPPIVRTLYSDQFRQDFSMFLRMRSQEMVHHGHLLLTLLCENSDAELDGSQLTLNLLRMALCDLVKEGYLKEEKLERFNVPLYQVPLDEIKQLIENEGSFRTVRFHTFKVGPGNTNDVFAADRNAPLHEARLHASTFRAVYEPVLATHFGEGIMDDLFRRFEDKVVNNIVQIRQCSANNVAISLRKR